MATKLVSMKMSPEKRDQQAVAPSMLTDGPAYPYGLSLSLDSDSLEKLEIDADDLKVGAKLTLIAKVEVSNLSSNESKDGGSYQNVGLQITDMCLESGTLGVSAADVLYKKKG